MLNETSPDAAPVHEGDVLDGKYRVERVLGVGGMGIVVAATHLQLDQRVALKFLLPAALGNPEVVARFAREARAAVRIQSEHVARVIDVGTLTTGSPYMVMEYLEGGDLAATLEARGVLPVIEAVTYVLQACEAIAEAHALGVVHRDLKPANLFLARRSGRDPLIKVLDFGISKTTDPAVSGLTQTATVMGSPLYMSPEQMMSSRDVDLRTDIWSLGVILYELLVGEAPFMAETMAQIVFLVTGRDAPSISEKRPDVAPGLAKVVQRCLRRSPEERFANVAELARALVPFGSSRADVSFERISRVLGTAGVTSLAPLPLVPAAPNSSEPALVESLPALPKTSGWPLMLAALAVLVLLLVAIKLWSAPGSSADAGAAPHIVLPSAPKAVAAPQAPKPEPSRVETAPDVAAPPLSPPVVVVASPPSAAPPRTPALKHARPKESARKPATPEAPLPPTRSNPMQMEIK
jgi:serine/threonine-protein kinase